MRTLVVLVTLECVYFGCWELTKRQGLVGVRRHVEAESPTVAAAYSTNVERAFSPAPFIVDVLHVELTEDRSTGYDSRRYYFWFCGIVTPTPNPISRSIGKCEELWFWATSPLRASQGGVI